MDCASPSNQPRHDQTPNYRATSHRERIPKPDIDDIVERAVQVIGKRTQSACRNPGQPACARWRSRRTATQGEDHRHCRRQPANRAVHHAPHSRLHGGHGRPDIAGRGDNQRGQWEHHSCRERDLPAIRIGETETDLGILDFQAARQPDTDHIVTWELAGAAQFDQATLNYSSASASRWNGASSAPGVKALCGPINVGPQPEVARAALERLRAWVVHGRRPPLARPLETTPDGEIARDADGNALGGVRTPAVDAPISSLTGAGSDASIFCALLGQERPFTRARLAELYPTHRAYTDAVTESADSAMEGGFLLETDRDAIVAKAERSNVGR